MGRGLKAIAVAISICSALSLPAMADGASVEDRIAALRARASVETATAQATDPALEDVNGFLARLDDPEAWTEAESQGPTDVIFYGDSRVVGMGMTLSENHYVGKVAEGYSWMVGAGYGELQSAMAQWPDADVVFCFGVNDVGNASAYAAWFNDFRASHPDRRAWFMSVNPIADGTAAANGYFARDSMVQGSNATLSASVGDAYLDVYSTLVSEGFGSPDGVHYDGATYSRIRDRAIELIAEKTA